MLSHLDNKLNRKENREGTLIKKKKILRKAAPKEVEIQFE